MSLPQLVTLNLRASGFFLDRTLWLRHPEFWNSRAWSTLGRKDFTNDIKIRPRKKLFANLSKIQSGRAKNRASGANSNLAGPELLSNFSS